jgi:hypothetical protein
MPTVHKMKLSLILSLVGILAAAASPTDLLAADAPEKRADTPSSVVGDVVNVDVENHTIDVRDRKTGVKSTYMLADTTKITGHTKTYSLSSFSEKCGAKSDDAQCVVGVKAGKATGTMLKADAVTLEGEAHGQRPCTRAFCQCTKYRCKACDCKKDDPQN